jgi:hypothetical protein
MPDWPSNTMFSHSTLLHSEAMLCLVEVSAPRSMYCVMSATLDPPHESAPYYLVIQSAVSV